MEQDVGRKIRVWLGFGLSLLGAGLGLTGFCESRRSRAAATRIEAQQYLWEAWDLMGGRPGTETISEGEFVQDEGQLQLAYRLIEKARLLDPKFAKVYGRLGSYWAARGQLGQALEAYGEAIRLDAKYVGAYINKGNVLSSLGHRHKAVEAYEAALLIEPTETLAHANLLKTLVELAQYGGALSAYERMTTDAPSARESIPRTLLETLAQSGSAWYSGPRPPDPSVATEPELHGLLLDMATAWDKAAIELAEAAELAAEEETPDQWDREYADEAEEGAEGGE